ncbi:MAG: 1,2-phenylacetyl-CoA epoxidase subunit PaaD [Saprospiraceae bacterium]|nr:phenylacetate-CoA oxygenase subunit PaaJ [Saprospiraceae bacterium]
MVTMQAMEHTAVMELLDQIPDPEIPVVSIREMGILRNVQLNGKHCEVTITPTYTACPAMASIADDIEALLKSHGFKSVKVHTVLSPPWSTSWMTEGTRQKLRTFGIAPPAHQACNNWSAEVMQVNCPRCGSHHTSVISKFGSTACKALLKCEECKEPFDYFKCH